MAGILLRVGREGGETGGRERGPLSKNDGREGREERGDEKDGNGIPPIVQVSRVNAGCSGIT